MTGAARLAGHVAPRYLAVGATCAGLNMIVLVGGDAIGLPLWASIAASFAIVCVAGYLLHAAVTFDAPASIPGLFRYVVAMAAGLPASAVLLWLFVSVLRWPMAWAAPAVTATMLLVNFLSSRWAVARPTRRRPAGIPS